MAFYFTVATNAVLLIAPREYLGVAKQGNRVARTASNLDDLEVDER
jgi:hypothetical protein